MSNQTRAKEILNFPKIVFLPKNIFSFLQLAPLKIFFYMQSDSTNIIEYFQAVVSNQNFTNEDEYKEFNWQFAPLSRVIIYSHRKSGKTTFLKYALFHTKHLFSWISIISSSFKDWDTFYFTFCCFHPNLNEYLRCAKCETKQKQSLLIYDDYTMTENLKIVSNLSVFKNLSIWCTMQIYTQSKLLFIPDYFIFLKVPAYSELRLPFRSNQPNELSLKTIFSTSVFNQICSKYTNSPYLAFVVDNLNGAGYYITSFREYKLILENFPKCCNKIVSSGNFRSTFEASCKIFMPIALMSVQQGKQFPLCELIWNYIATDHCMGCFAPKDEQNCNFVFTWRNDYLTIHRYICELCESNQSLRWLRMLQL